jgi:hypothetical protein
MGAKKAFGTKAFVGTVSGGTEIATLTNIRPPGVSVDTVESTGHDTATAYRTWISTLANYDELEVEGNLAAASLTQLNAKILVDDQAYGVRFAFGTPVTMDFVGTLTKLKVGDAPIDGKLTFSASFKVSGNVTFGGT